MATPSPNTESPLPAEAVYDAIGPAYQDAYAGVADKLAASILDIGCGTGVPVCRLLADAGHDVLGIDISAAMLAAARERVPHANAHFEKCDIRDFDRPDGSFDAASAYFSLIMGLSQEEIRGAWRKVFGLLKGAGCLCL
ncbi:S-adenosyl-L-methionine-dependent methyltransferase [Bombardia bombarda]|uniref:S-adenosyl-L-methionine-dependent methyltransferase n=1 Tax=Bombardia bombarda TaxID=252184 RepID=A0AA39XAN2_9PEZI|nr:S-adenosyl-L-methionine-dependent methyltransferase [Bombardia bombarda]